MKRRSFFAAICAVLGFRLILRSPARPYTATDVLRDRQRYLTDTHEWYFKVEPPPETRWMYLTR